MLTDAIAISAGVDERREGTRVGDDAYVTRERRATAMLEQHRGGLQAAKHEAGVAVIDGAARDAVKEVAERDANGSKGVDTDDLGRAGRLAAGALDLGVVITEALLFQGGVVA